MKSYNQVTYIGHEDQAGVLRNYESCKIDRSMFRSHNVMSRNAKSHNVMSRNAKSHNVMSHNALSHNVMSHNVISQNS